MTDKPIKILDFTPNYTRMTTLDQKRRDNAIGFYKEIIVFAKAGEGILDDHTTFLRCRFYRTGDKIRCQMWFRIVECNFSRSDTSMHGEGAEASCVDWALREAGFTLSNQSFIGNMDCGNQTLLAVGQYILKHQTKLAANYKINLITTS